MVLSSVFIMAPLKEKEEASLIEIEHLTKRYGDITAVSDLSIRIESGQIYGLQGPNVEANSTTMKNKTG